MGVYLAVAKQSFRRQSTYRFDLLRRDELTAAEALARVSAVTPVRDLTLEEPAIDDIVRRIYLGEV